MRLASSRVVGDLGRGRRGQADGASRVHDAVGLDLCDGICRSLRYARMGRLRGDWRAGPGLRYETGQNIVIRVGVHSGLRVIAWKCGR